MPALAANLTMLFTEMPFSERFAAAAAAGFRGVEFQFPYTCTEEELVEKLVACDLVAVLHNLPAGDWPHGERGIACLPDRVGEFRAGVEIAIKYAMAIGCRQLNCLAGIAPPGFPPDLVRQTLVGNLTYAAERLQGVGIKLLVEALNTRDTPGFYLHNTKQVLEILGDVDSDNAFLQYDMYHMQIMEGDLATTIERHVDRIAHVQIADHPGRHEPGTGEIDYPFLLAHLDRVGYCGWVGCEYVPAGKTLEGLGWRSSLARHA